MHTDSTILELSLEVACSRNEKKSLFESSIDYAADVRACKHYCILNRVKSEIDRIIALQVKIEINVFYIATLVIYARKFQCVNLLQDGWHHVVFDVFDKL